MTINIHRTPKLIFAGMLCASLTACGSSKEEIIEEVVEDAINAGNYQEILSTGVLETAKLAAGVMFAGNEIDTSIMTLDSATESSNVYRCSNTDGLLEVTLIDDTTEQWDFDNCHITYYDSDSAYDGRVLIDSEIISGDYEDIGDYNANWSVSQYVTFTNFTQTSPIDGGKANTSNGSIILDSSNSLDTELNIATMSSTNLIIDSADTTTLDTTTYTFSDLYYDLREDIIDESLDADLDFTAEVSGIGEIQVITDPILEYDTDGLLQDGMMTVLSGNSALSMVATGNDTVDISLDANNDGTYEFTISQDWDIGSE